MKNVLTNIKSSAIIYSSKENRRETKRKIIQFIAYINVT